MPAIASALQGRGNGVVFEFSFKVIQSQRHGSDSFTCSLTTFLSRVGGFIHAVSARLYRQAAIEADM
jgi:hypothetical protein